MEIALLVTNNQIETAHRCSIRFFVQGFRRTRQFKTMIFLLQNKLVLTPNLMMQHVQLQSKFNSG